MKRKVIIFIHGFKIKNKNDFEDFINKNKEKFNDIKIVKLHYYDSNDKKTLNYKKFDLEVKKIFDKYKDYEIKIIGYSLGVLVSLKNSIDYNNIKDLYLIMPTLFINYWDWIIKLKNSLKKNRILKKRLGKERYKSLKEKSSEKYPIRLLNQINKYLKKNRNKIKFVKDKNIIAIYSNNDEISAVNKTMPFFKKKLKNNKLSLIEVKDNHYNVLDDSKIENINNLIKFIIK